MSLSCSQVVEQIRQVVEHEPPVEGTLGKEPDEYRVDVILEILKKAKVKVHL
jgi:hypothetical protein